MKVLALMFTACLMYGVQGVADVDADLAEVRQKQEKLNAFQSIVGAMLPGVWTEAGRLKTEERRLEFVKGNYEKSDCIMRLEEFEASIEHIMSTYRNEGPNTDPDYAFRFVISEESESVYKNMEHYNKWINLSCIRDNDFLRIPESQIGFIANQNLLVSVENKTEEGLVLINSLNRIKEFGISHSQITNDEYNRTSYIVMLEQENIDYLRGVLKRYREALYRQIVMRSQELY